MHKGFLKLLIPVFALILAASLASAAYYYDGGYKKEYTVKETYDDYGYSYYERNINKDPWGEKTTYTKIKDYDGYRSSYRNRANDYWNDGPTGYSRTYRAVNTYNDDWRYLGNYWNDDYQRTYPTQYTDYYYHPRYFYNGNTYNWEGRNEPGCGRNVRCGTTSYCGNNIYRCSW